ncbi:hypothetical protein C8N32_10261 [Rhodovulum imhoffii]|uniref:Methyltransferase family protein n=1 Tax=Rhodovulum imhoffii TaxID=365340 RepID=A0A2T5BVG8_9RHOB|nr:class I SAM-dependent methyltransferase [Rhodovulum imhoffii]MBK5934213.1 hypothetical protein [Rhodovulum imhoffii]PTN03540.1 hypothetical protein C8N32_10261 [Rhodovulum imhoffii]
MGIPDTLAARIIEYVNEFGLSGHLLMLGRQSWGGSRKGPSARMLARTIKTYYPDLTEADFHRGEERFAEPFFERLGFEQVDSLDISDFEGASIIVDLSQPVPDQLHGKFDVIYDGGTCEHIFDLPTAYRNIDRMLKVGGVLIGHSPCNNWINHGFFQICPETVYGFWEKSMGYELLECRLQPIRPAHAEKAVRTSNPNVTGKRPRLLGDIPSTPIMLDYAVRKTRPSGQAPQGAYQTDYLEHWQRKNRP